MTFVDTALPNPVIFVRFLRPPSLILSFSLDRSTCETHPQHIALAVQLLFIGFVSEDSLFKFSAMYRRRE